MVTGESRDHGRSVWIGEGIQKRSFQTNRGSAARFNVARNVLAKSAQN